MLPEFTASVPKTEPTSEPTTSAAPSANDVVWVEADGEDGRKYYFHMYTGGEHSNPLLKAQSGRFSKDFVPSRIRLGTTSVVLHNGGVWQIYSKQRIRKYEAREHCNEDGFVIPGPRYF